MSFACGLLLIHFVWIDAQKAYQKRVKNLDDYFQKGQIEILDQRVVYQIREIRCR